MKLHVNAFSLRQYHTSKQNAAYIQYIRAIRQSAIVRYSTLINSVHQRQSVTLIAHHHKLTETISTRPLAVLHIALRCRQVVNFCVIDVRATAMSLLIQVALLSQRGRAMLRVCQ